MAIHKAELIQSIAQKNGLSAAKAGEILTNLIETIVDETATGNNVTITGFGTFAVKTRSARSGVNALTGKPFSSPAKKTLTFKASTSVKKTLN